MCVQGLQTEVKARFSSVLRPIYISILFQDTAQKKQTKCEFDNNIMQLSFDYPFWYFMSTGSELIYDYFPISTGKDVKWVPVK